MKHLIFVLDKDHADGRPAHIEVQGASRRPGEWFPCEHPERMLDDVDMGLHDCCPRCLIAVEAGERRGVKCWDATVGRPVKVLMRERLDEWGPAPRLEPVR